MLVCATAGEAIRSRRALTEMNCFIECNLSLDQRFAVERPQSELLSQKPGLTQPPAVSQLNFSRAMLGPRGQTHCCRKIHTETRPVSPRDQTNLRYSVLFKNDGCCGFFSIACR